MKKPLVSVLMLSYNQEKFIEQALQSAIDQQVNFPYEIVIGDDCSSDKTREMLNKYKKKYPNLLKVLLNKKNLKPVHNLMNVYKNCNGKYIAILEGDDYWTSSHKLQKQVDFLESHPKYAICYHFTKMCDNNGKELLLLPIEKFRKKIATIKDLADNDSFMATCSTMFRNKLFGDFPNWFKELTYIADYPLNILNAQHGDIGLLYETMSVYRAQSSSNAFTSQSIITVHLEKIKVFLGVNRHLQYSYNSSIQDRMAGYYFVIARAYLDEYKLDLSKKFYKLYTSKKHKTHYISLVDRVIFKIRLFISDQLLKGI